MKIPARRCADQRDVCEIVVHLADAADTIAADSHDGAHDDDPVGAVEKLFRRGLARQVDQLRRVAADPEASLRPLRDLAPDLIENTDEAERTELRGWLR